MRNVSESDTVIIRRAQYFNTAGESIRMYLKNAIYLKPMETVEIVIDQLDKAGGTGGNFIFDWSVAPDTPEPVFEAVMISGYDKLGLSFSTQSKRIK